MTSLIAGSMRSACQLIPQWASILPSTSALLRPKVFAAASFHPLMWPWQSRPIKIEGTALMKS
jgi:hypothetical protein